MGGKGVLCADVSTQYPLQRLPSAQLAVKLADVTDDCML